MTHLMMMTCRSLPPRASLILILPHLLAFGFLDTVKPAADAIEFLWGVASGDPTSTSVIIWTRARNNATAASGSLGLRWEVASLGNMQENRMWDTVQEGDATTNASTDWTVKLTVDNLTPGTTYFYRFTDVENATRSVVGRTRTLPDAGADLARLQLAVISCINYQGGYFTALEHLADNASDLFGVVALGDFIYEYGSEGYWGNESPIDREPDPPRETVQLADYRKRYAQYRTTSELSKAMRWLPWFMVWDDHEFANNAWESGAANHDPKTEGPWPQRKNDAIQAYLEYTPKRAEVEPDGKTRIFRSFRFGKLAELIMLDTRAYGRDPIEKDAESVGSWNRTILGLEQEKWLNATLGTTKQESIRWKVIGNQVLFSALKIEDLGIIDRVILNDAWNGYPATRRRVVGYLEENNIKNVVWATGDIHSSWAIDVNDPDKDDLGDRSPIGLELITPSISSPLFVKRGIIGDAAEKLILGLEDQVKWVDLQHHGYYVLTLTKESVTGEWYFVETVEEPNAKVWLAKTVTRQAVVSEQAGEDRGSADEPTPSSKPSSAPNTSCFFFSVLRALLLIVVLLVQLKLFCGDL